MFFCPVFYTNLETYRLSKRYIALYLQTIHISLVRKQINYTYDDIRKWLEHFRTLDYTKAKNRKALIDTFIYRVLLYDDKMKLIFNLKGGQKNELLLNLIFPGTDGNGGEVENSAKEKETENSVSQSGCSYTPVMVHPKRLELPTFRSVAERSIQLSYECISLLHLTL